MALITMGLGIWILFGSTTSNPCNYKSIGDIPTPWGYERISGDDPAYSEFLRKLPLKSKGSDVMLYTGGRSRFQSLNYAVVAVPLLSNAEQCADVCMRLRAEYRRWMQSSEEYEFRQKKAPRTDPRCFIYTIYS